MKRPVTFYSEGCKLVGDVYYPDDLQPGETRAGIVLCHGYTGVKDLYLPDNARVLNEAGYMVMTFDYKGWGESAGARSRLAPYSRVADVQAAVTFLGTLPEVDANRITIRETPDAVAASISLKHDLIADNTDPVALWGTKAKPEPLPVHQGHTSARSGPALMPREPDGEPPVVVRGGQILSDKRTRSIAVSPIQQAIIRQ